MRRSTLLAGVLAVAVLTPAVPATADHAHGVRAAAARLHGALGRQAVVDIDRRTGTPRHLARLDGFLSGPRRDDPVEVARRYIAAHAAALGIEAGDVTRHKLVRSYTSPIGVTHVTFAQTYGGIPAFDGFVRVNVARDGRVVNLVGSPVRDLGVASTRPALTPRAARAAAMRDAGAAGPVPDVATSRGDPERATRFEDGEKARLVIFDGARLAWYLSPVADDSLYLVDANNGRVLWQQDITSDVAGKVWDYYPVDRGSRTDGHTQTFRAFPAAWLRQDARTLNGRNAHVYSDVADDDRAGPADEIPRSGPGTWDYPAKLHVQAGACSVFAPCTWNSAVPASWDAASGNLRQNATQVFYYVNRFHDWLAGAPFGFDKAGGNFEGADRLEVQTLDGAGTSDALGGPARAGGGFPDADHMTNANMRTPPDGQRPLMQMYLFPAAGGGPDLNGGDDASVVYHEYTHGLSARLVTFATGTSGLVGHQARSMGEGWGDWYAMDYLAAHGFHSGAVNFAFFANGSRPNRPDGTTLRSQPLNCLPLSTTTTDGGDQCLGTAAAGDGGYTYGDLGKVAVDLDTGMPVRDIHGDGEIWGQTLWQLRDRLQADLGRATGLERARLLITEAMRLSPTQPSFLDMRDAILAADTANGSCDRVRIWDVFAQRGMGFNASTDGTRDLAPEEDFSLPSGGGTARRAGPLTVSAQRIRCVLSSGLAVGVTSDRPARAVVSVRFDDKTARRIGHRGVAGRATERLSGAGQAVPVTIRLARLRRAAAHALRRQRSTGLTVTVRLTGADERTTTVRSTVRLRR
jgi:extracellular elastinolytic metalloproteinase